MVGDALRQSSIYIQRGTLLGVGFFHYFQSGDYRIGFYCAVACRNPSAIDRAMLALLEILN